MTTYIEDLREEVLNGNDWLSDEIEIKQGTKWVHVTFFFSEGTSATTSIKKDFFLKEFRSRMLQGSVHSDLRRMIGEFGYNNPDMIK